MRKFLIISAAFFLLSMIISPQSCYEAASEGLALWWNIIFPSLLPFFITAEILLQLGALENLGRRLEPLMRPLFRLPGASALAVLMGFCAGFPTGAAITAGLRQHELITRDEGERLLAFTNNPSPLFILVAVSTGILAQPQLGLLLLGINYGLNLLLGIILGLFSPSSPGEQKTIRPKSTKKPAETRPGAILRRAGQKAASNITLVGCYIIFFSCLTRMIENSGLIGLICRVLKLNPALGQALGGGFWEMSLGINHLAGFSLASQIALASAILAWSGFSVQAQVAAMVSDTDIKVGKYMICRAIHALASFALATFIVNR
ncbi:MAG: sporulation integral membrane protein YlbJ [Clostridiales bacterium]|jgi:sporulation integral membrane protein YlbJ|nr:sporulation integral membrane protein YlbJ [Clostridiales bacterium]